MSLSVWHRPWWSVNRQGRPCRPSGAHATGDRASEIRASSTPSARKPGTPPCQGPADGMHRDRRRGSGPFAWAWCETGHRNMAMVFARLHHCVPTAACRDSGRVLQCLGPATRNPREWCPRGFSGRSRIRTLEGVSRRIYSPLPLAARATCRATRRQRRNPTRCPAGVETGAVTPPWGRCHRCPAWPGTCAHPPRGRRHRMRPSAATPRYQRTRTPARAARRS